MFDSIYDLCYGPSFHSVVDVPGVNFQQTHAGGERMFCHVFLALPTGTFLSTTNLVHAFT